MVSVPVRIPGSLRGRGGGHGELVHGRARQRFTLVPCPWLVRQPVPEVKTAASEPWTEDGVKPLSPLFKDK